MTGGSPPKTEVEAREKRAKDKVRKSGTSAQNKALRLGEFADVFSAVVYYNPTYRWLDGAVHVPEGQDIPDVNAFFAQILDESSGNSPRHGPRRAQTSQQSPLDAQTDTSVRNKLTAETASIRIDAAAEREAGAGAGVPHSKSSDGMGAHYVDASPISHRRVTQECQVAKDTDSERQLRQHLADSSALRGTSRRVVKEERADDEVADDAGWADTSGNVWDVSTHRYFNNVVGNKVQDGQSGPVPGWETRHSPYAEAPIARVTPPNLSKVRAAIRRRLFFRQVSLNMQLASRRERLPPHQLPHQDIRKSLSRQSGR